VLLIQHRLWLVSLVHLIHWIPRLQQLQLGAGEKYWSSDALYRGRARREGLVTHVVLHILSHGARRRDVQEAAYRKHFDGPPDAEHIRLFSNGSPEDPRMLGDAEFLADIWLTTRQTSPRQNRGVPIISDVRQAVVDVVEKFSAMCDLALPRGQARAWKRVVTLEQVCSHSRKRPLPMIRALIASYVIACHIANRAQAAQFFGCGPETLSVDRRRHAEVLFRESFGITSDALFSTRRGGD
jgi:hypothetical protein